MVEKQSPAVEGAREKYKNQQKEKTLSINSLRRSKT